MKILFLFIILNGFCSGIIAQEKDSSTNRQFIYVLKLTSAYQDEKNWNDSITQIIQVHFKRLKDMLADGKLIFGGRADVDPLRTFGIVVYDAKSIEEATTIANDDPAVKAGIMSVEVFPFNVALMRKE